MTHGRFIFTFAAMMACACCVFGDLQEDRKAANKLRNDGNVREAYDAYAKLALNPQNPAKYAINDFNMAVNCLQQLNRIGEFDDFLKKVLEVRKDDWRFVSGYHYPMNQGYIIDGKFTRGWNRGGQARFIDVRFADTLSQIKLMVKNMPPVTEEGADQFYMRLADIFANSANMGYSKAGLNILMDITQEPDYLNPHVIGSITNGTPVDADGNPVPAGENGEIVIRTDRANPHPGIFIGYYKDKEKTDEVWRGGFYHTGDLAWRDENGYYHYVGRADDVIKSSGYRIGPAEIENVIMELPYVLECGVSAAPDPVRGQVVKASIVLVKGVQGTDTLKEEVQRYVKEHTAPYKYPRIVVFRDALPKTISGKIQRNLL